MNTFWSLNQKSVQKKKNIIRERHRREKLDVYDFALISKLLSDGEISVKELSHCGYSNIFKRDTNLLAEANDGNKAMFKLLLIQARRV